MKIEDAREHQKQLVLKWESRVEELTRVITKYPWNKMEYDFGDWRESEIKGRTQQIAESNLIIEALEKQINGDLVEVVRCKDCKHSQPEDQNRVFCTIKGQLSNKKSFCEAMEK